jgi:hypothetical protein
MQSIRTTLKQAVTAYSKVQEEKTQRAASRENENICIWIKWSDRSGKFSWQKVATFHPIGTSLPATAQAMARLWLIARKPYPRDRRKYYRVLPEGQVPKE